MFFSAIQETNNFLGLSEAEVLDSTVDLKPYSIHMYTIVFTCIQLKCKTNKHHLNIFQLVNKQKRTFAVLPRIQHTLLYTAAPMSRRGCELSTGT